MEKTVTLAQKYKDYMIALRREFHQNPEASGEEYNTSRRVAEELKVMGLSPNIICKTGVAVDIEGTGTGKGKTVALRADMDALSVQEINDVPYKSKVDGLMHACGHDGHTASLLGAARILSECRDQFSGVVRLLFQPAEEIAVGAPAMIEAGLLDGVDGTLGIHLWSGVKSGTISVEAGPRMAAANIFKYKIIGKPGHGALPHEGVDAGLAASAIVLNLQSLVSREFTALAPLVITVGRIESGTRWNVIASEATIEGTVRCFDPDIFRQVPDVMWRVIRDTAAAYRCEAEAVDVRAITLPCVNPEATSRFAADVAKKLFGEQAVALFPLQMGGEDYSFMMEKVPDSLIAFVGIGNPEKGSDVPHHAGNFQIDEDALPMSAAFYAQYAIDFLNR